MLQLAQIEDAVNQTLRKSTQAVSLHALNSKPQQLRILLLVMLIAEQCWEWRWRSQCMVSNREVILTCIMVSVHEQQVCQAGHDDDQILLVVGVGMFGAPRPTSLDSADDSRL